MIVWCGVSVGVMRHAAARLAAGGADLEECPGAVAAISLIYSTSLSTFWGYIGVFAVEGLHWRPGQVGLVPSRRVGGGNSRSGQSEHRAKTGSSPAFSRRE